MLTRLYIDNFRCFVNFEYKPARRQLILGANGTGKSTLVDALLFLRQFALRGDVFDSFPILSQRTRWLNQPRQAFEVEAALAGKQFTYRLAIEPWGDPERPRVMSETVQVDGKPIFEFLEGEVHLYNDRLEHKVTYPFDWYRSALATIMERKDNQLLTRFKRWFGSLLCFKLNPFGMAMRAEGEQLYVNADLSNIAAWYRHLVQADPEQNATMLESLRASIDGFSYLKLEPVGENVRLLMTEFVDAAGKTAKYGFSELSDGQRCLVCLYAILHFLLARGNTVILDEPDNFVSLREIQPWLMAVSDAVEESNGQVLLISHHPELIDQWAPDCGIRFIRNGGGPARVGEFRGDPASALSPAELVARGWENE